MGPGPGPRAGPKWPHGHRPKGGPDHPGPLCNPGHELCKCCVIIDRWFFTSLFASISLWMGEIVFLYQALRGSTSGLALLWLLEEMPLAFAQWMKRRRAQLHHSLLLSQWQQHLMRACLPCGEVRLPRPGREPGICCNKRGVLVHSQAPVGPVLSVHGPEACGLMCMWAHGHRHRVQARTLGLGPLARAAPGHGCPGLRVTCVTRVL